MEKKEELIALTESIQDEKALAYILGFVKAFCQRYMYFKDGKWIR